VLPCLGSDLDPFDGAAREPLVRRGAAMTWLASTTPAGTTLTVRPGPPDLVGRDTELAALAEVAARPACVVLIEGEAGIGKTRLVRELVRAPRMREVRVLLGTCQPVRDPFPYGGVLEALRAVDPARIAALSPVAGVLRPLLPELTGALPPAPPPAPDRASDRHREFRALRELLGACGPALLVLEDLHCADPNTLDLLRFLVGTPQSHLGVVLTSRHPIPVRAGDGMRTARVRLGPLDPGQVRRLAAAVLGAPRVGEEFATELHALTAGIPLVVEETLRGLGGTEPPSLDAVEVPPSVRDTMAARTGALPTVAQHLAGAVAVLGTPADTELIGGLCGLRGARLTTALARVTDAGVLYEVAPNHYDFRHPLARRAVYEALGGPRRRQAHAQALRALAGVEPAPLRRLATHAREAGRTEQWLRLAEAAADEATDDGDTAQAIDLLQALLSEAALDEDAVERLATKLSRISLRGLHQEVMATLRRLLAERPLSRTARGTIRLHLGMLIVRTVGSLERGRTEVERAIDELADRPELAARGINLLAQPIDGTTPLEWHEGWARRAAEVYDRLTDPELRLALTVDRIACRSHIGDGSAWGEFERLALSPSTVAERVQQARLWCNLADAQSWAGHLDRAERLAADALGEGEATGALFVVGLCRSTTLRLDWLRGNWAGLAETGEALRVRYRDIGPVVTEAELVLGALAAVRGEFAVAERHLRATSVAAPEHGAIPVVLAATGMLVRIRLATGDVAAACTAADRGMAVARAKGVWVWAAELVPAVVDAYARAGRLAEVDAVLGEFTRGIEGRDAPVGQAALALGLGTLLAARNETAGAVRALEDAAARYAELPMPYAATGARERAARCGLAGGDGTAVERLAVAAEEYERLGAASDAGRCRRELREHGAWAPSQRGRRGYGQELSPREREVARMLAGGRTNREIAEGLFLSPRTVEQHVAKVLRKLGARSRAEVAQRELTPAEPVPR
jgi:DNA-binding CsgD family transcriptional regulator